MVIPSRQSEARTPNSKLKSRPRRKKETNCHWLARVLDDGEKPEGWICLIGGTNLTDFRLRVAQSHVRSDLLPSFWSHAAIVTEAKGASPQQWRLHEVPLEPAGGFQDVPSGNGVQEGSLENYDDSGRYPNFALIDFHIDPREIRAAIDRFSHQRALIDVPGLMVEWLAFAWGAGERGNPLLAYVGMPSAAFVEGVFALAGLELTPGLSSRSSCPEAIWQGAKWWHGFYASEATAIEPPAGFYVIGQEAAAVVAEPET